MTRLVLVSGETGVAEAAAATALHAAGRGSRTLLLAADDPHRLLDGLLGARLSGAVESTAEGLWAARIDEQEAFRRAVDTLNGRLKSGFDLLGVEPLEEDELTALPGTRQLALLRALREPTASGSGTWWWWPPRRPPS